MPLHKEIQYGVVERGDMFFPIVLVPVVLSTFMLNNRNVFHFRTPLCRGSALQNEYQSKEQRAKSKEQRAKSKEQRAKSKEQRAKSKEQRAKSKEQRAKSKEQRAKSKEQRAKSKEQRAKHHMRLSA